jgi:hypothetical protein
MKKIVKTIKITLTEEDVAMIEDAMSGWIRYGVPMATAIRCVLLRASGCKQRGRDEVRFVP